MRKLSLLSALLTCSLNKNLEQVKTTSGPSFNGEVILFVESAVYRAKSNPKK